MRQIVRYFPVALRQLRAQFIGDEQTWTGPDNSVSQI
jgi:hypothetical protein